MTLREQIAADIEDCAAWFNPDEFGRYHDIDGVRVLSVFAGDTRSEGAKYRTAAFAENEGVFRSEGVLYVRAHEIEDVHAGQVMRLDGRLYTVNGAELIQDAVWRIALEVNTV